MIISVIILRIPYNIHNIKLIFLCFSNEKILNFFFTLNIEIATLKYLSMANSLSFKHNLRCRISKINKIANVWHE